MGSYYQVLLQIDSARYYYKKSASFWDERGDRERYASTVSSLGMLEQLDGNYDTARDMFDKAIQLYKAVGNISHMANTIGSKASAHIDQGNYHLALLDALESLRIRDSLKTKPWRKADALRQVGQIEHALENNKSAIAHYERAVKIYDSIGDNIYLGHTYADLGSAYFDLDDYDEAIAQYEKSMDIAKVLTLPDMEENALANLGMVYSKLGQYDRSIALLEEALSKNRERNSMINHINNLIELGQAWNRKGSPEQGLDYLDRAVRRADSIGAKSKLQRAYDLRARSHEAMGNYRQSTRDLRRHQLLNDSIFNTTKSRQIEELRTLYETEKKEQQIVLQEQEIDLLEQEAKIGELQRILLAVGLLLSVLGFYALRQKMKRNRLEREKIAAELDFKKKELTTHALHLAKKNEVLENVKQKAKELKLAENTEAYGQLIRAINFDQQDDKNWERFIQYFEQVHQNFAANVKTKYPKVSKNELRFMALIKMNMSSKEIATILSISPDGIKKARQRLRKKLALAPQDSLENTVLAI